MGDHSCQKQHRQNDPAGQVDLPTKVEVRVMGDHPVKNHTDRMNLLVGYLTDVMSHCLSKTTQTA